MCVHACVRACECVCVVVCVMWGGGCLCVCVHRGGNKNKNPESDLKIFTSDMCAQFCKNVANLCTLCQFAMSLFLTFNVCCLFIPVTSLKLNLGFYQQNQQSAMNRMQKKKKKPNKAEQDVLVLVLALFVAVISLMLSLINRNNTEQ